MGRTTAIAGGLALLLGACSGWLPSIGFVGSVIRSEHTGAGYHRVELGLEGHAQVGWKLGPAAAGDSSEEPTVPRTQSTLGPCASAALCDWEREATRAALASREQAP